MKVEGVIGFYHCFSRVVDGRFIFGEEEKARFLKLMREEEAFCGVRVLTYCLMSNHFHVLVEVPPRPERLLTGEELLSKLRGLSGPQDVGWVETQLKGYRRLGDEAGERAFLKRYEAQMWDVSGFMKLLKQRFTQWYNRRMERRGTLWEERFGSVLVDGVGHALGAMAAYIDLNPVRAGLVGDPKDYRWSGYGEAMAGKRSAREGLCRVVAGLRGGEAESMSRSLEVYRMWVYQEGSEERDALGEDGKPVRGALPRQEVLKVLAAKGRLGLADYLRCRVRYFSGGVALGSRAYVEDVLRRYRVGCDGRRAAVVEAMAGLQGIELFAGHRFRAEVFG